MQASRLLATSGRGAACLRRPQGPPLLAGCRSGADARRRSCAAAPRPLTTAAAASGGAGSSKRRGRPKKAEQVTDPHQLSNVDADSMHSDPGDLGRVAEGVLEKYEHLERLHPAPPSSAAAAAGAKTGERGAGPPSDYDRMEALAHGAAGLGEGAGAGAGEGLDLHAGELSADEMHCDHPEAQGPCCSLDQGDRQGGGGASTMLATDSPGAPQAQHPGEVAEAALAPEAAGEAGEGAGVQDVE